MDPRVAASQTMDLGNLSDYWQMARIEFSRIERLPSLSAGRLLSARAFDESQVAGPRIYMEVTRYLGVARDNHEALLALLEHRGATLWAPWSLLRPIFESSFFAAWILDPEDGQERRARGLRCEIRDMVERRKHRAEFKAIPEARGLIEEADLMTDKTSGAIYRTEAAQLGRRYDSLRQEVNVRDELAKLSFVVNQEHVGSMLRATWRQLSGFEHGLGWAMMSSVDSEVLAEIPGGANMHLTINDQAFVNVVKATYFLLLSASRLLVKRHTEPVS